MREALTDDIDGQGSIDRDRPAGGNGRSRARPAAAEPTRGNRGALKPIWLSDVQAEDVKWLWQNRIPMGKLSLLMGNPGLGKSYFAVDAAARVSTGTPWPDGSPCPQGRVLLFSAEDGISDTVRPRFDAASGDPAKVACMNTLVDADGNRLPFTLDRDMPILIDLVKELHDIKLIVIDPVACYMGKQDTHKNSETRVVLGMLADMAEQHGVAILVITHLNKNASQSAAHRANGTIAFTAAARACWLIAEDRDDNEEQKRSLFLPIKSNLAPKQPGLSFRIERGKLEWQPGTVSTNADEALAIRTESRVSVVDKVQTALQDLLANGPIATEVAIERLRGMGFSDSAIERARERLGVHSFRPKGSVKWFISLVDPIPAEPQTCGHDRADAAVIEHIRGNG